nr:unnamed protein product [Callosobruchus chinensis]
MAFRSFLWNAGWWGSKCIIMSYTKPITFQLEKLLGRNFCCN